jgi:hypothetical protein
MSGTTNLNAPLITASQNQKEVTANAAFARFDAALTETLAVSVASANAAPTAEEVRAAFLLAVSGATTAGRTVTLPVMKKPAVVTLDAASTKAVSIVRGTKSFTLYPGGALEVYTTGDANGLVRIGEFGPARRDHWVRGVPDDDEIIARWQVQEGSVLLPDLLGWDVQADTAATASTVFQVRREGSQVGTITFAISGTVPTYATTSNAAQSFTAGEFIDIKGPATADATLAGIFFHSLLMRA